MNPVASRPARSRLVPMRPRDPREPARTASELELFFDLVFVVAVSVSSVQLHHALSEGHVADGVVSYLMVFFSIWWAWMNFTWFATAFDTDDWLYRVLTLVQMAGVLVLAAGVADTFGEERDYTVVTLGYVIMRVALVAQWLRAAHGDASLRRTTLAYAVGISTVQVLWLLRLALPESLATVSFLVLVAAELAVPVLAERVGPTPWHPHHVAERYGLFTLIVLGESVLASANAFIGALDDSAELVPLVAMAVLAFVVTAALWWTYFWAPHHRTIDGGGALRYGYAHYLVFAAAGAFSAGVEVEIDALSGHGELSQAAAAWTVSVPVAVFVLGIWAIALRPAGDRVVNAAVPLAALLVLGDAFVPVPLLVTAVVMAAVVVVLVRRPAEA